MRYNHWKSWRTSPKILRTKHDKSDNYIPIYKRRLSINIIKYHPMTS